MDGRVLGLGGVLSLAGCFAEPGEVEQDADTVQGARLTEGSTGSTGAATGLGTLESTSSESMSSSGVPVLCTPVGPALAAPMDADVIVLLDSGALDDPEALTTTMASWRSSRVNHAVVVHSSDLDTLEEDSFACLQGCGNGGGCGSTARSVRVVYDGDSALEAAAKDPGAFDCMLRNSAPGTTGPTRHVLLVTSNPDQRPPSGLLEVLDNLGARFHLSCPSCSSDEVAASPLLEWVEASAGSVSAADPSGAFGEQLVLLGEQRMSCRWPTRFDGEPELAVGVVEIRNAFIEATLGFESLPVLPVDDEAGCSEFEDGESAELAYFLRGESSDLDVRLCPLACLYAQLEPAQVTELTEVVCE